MLFDLWERYKRLILTAFAVLFVGASVWIYQSDAEGSHAELPFYEAEYADSDFAVSGTAGGGPAPAPAPAAAAAPDAKAAAGSDVVSAASQAADSQAHPQAAGPQAQPYAGGTQAQLQAAVHQAERQAAVSAMADPPGNPAARLAAAAAGHSPADPAPLLYVDVKGRVNQPGLYALQPGARVADAIAKAGGISPDGDAERINLAEPLVDGSALIVPAKGNAASTGQSGIVSAVIPSAGVSGSAPSAAKAAPAQTSKDPAAEKADKGVNINTAGLQELMTLPGVGESRAHAIIQYRSEKGAFRSPEELKRISGIGDKIYERMKEHVRIQ